MKQNLNNKKKSYFTQMISTSNRNILHLNETTGCHSACIAKQMIVIVFNEALKYCKLFVFQGNQ